MFPDILVDVRRNGDFVLCSAIQANHGEGLVFLLEHSGVSDLVRAVDYGLSAASFISAEAPLLAKR